LTPHITYFAAKKKSVSGIGGKIRGDLWKTQAMTPCCAAPGGQALKTAVFIPSIGKKLKMYKREIRSCG
jgi:hypothetical protein